MRIVYCGDLWEGGTCRMRLEALRRLGHTVIGVDTSWQPRGFSGLLIRALRKVGYAWDGVGANEALLRAVAEHKPDVVWIDKGLTILPHTLRRIRQLAGGARLLHYSPDDMAGKHNQSRQYLAGLGLYDLHVTTKSFNVPELLAVGAAKVLFVDNAYCPSTHRPVSVSDEERVTLGGPVGFIGAFEKERAEAMLFLARNGVPVRIWGGWGKGWQAWAERHNHPNLRVEGSALWGDDYAKAICSFDINLCFLRKLNRDLQTTRSVEIPACGGFMLAEWTDEHLKLFKEGVEAEFFGSREELLEKCQYYLAHPEERRRIAAVGRERCLRSDYSYDRQLAAVLDALGSPVKGR
jgi:hypothetical protein